MPLLALALAGCTPSIDPSIDILPPPPRAPVEEPDPALPYLGDAPRSDTGWDGSPLPLLLVHAEGAIVPDGAELEPGTVVAPGVRDGLAEA